MLFIQLQLKQAAVIVNGGVLLFAGINLYKGNEKFYDDIVMPVFKLFSPETSHNISIKLAKYKIVPKPQKPDPPSLVRKYHYEQTLVNFLQSLCFKILGR